MSLRCKLSHADWGAEAFHLLRKWKRNVLQIDNFDKDKYLLDLERFNKNVIGLKETGNASCSVVEWMLNKRMK